MIGQWNIVWACAQLISILDIPLPLCHNVFHNKLITNHIKIFMYIRTYVCTYMYLHALRKNIV